MSFSREGTTDLFDAIYTQRAIRYFRPDPVPEDLLWRVVEAATKAPSGSNRQPWEFLVIQDATRRETIGRLLREAMGTDSPMARYFAEGARSDDHGTRLMLSGAQNLLQKLDQAPVFIIPCFYSPTSPVSNTLRAGSSIYGAVQNLQLAARGLGLGTVLTTFDQAIEPQLRTLLKLPDEAQPVALIPLGFPNANFGPTKRRPVSQVTHWEAWGERRDQHAPRWPSPPVVH